MIAWFAKNGVAANLLAGIILLAGVISIRGLKMELFPDFDLDSLRKSNTELEDLFEKFYNGEADEEKASLLNYQDQMDAQDPPLYIYNPVFEDQVISEDNSIDFNVLFHSYRHADYLRKKATEVGQEFSGAYQELPQEFIKRVLKN